MRNDYFRDQTGLAPKPLDLWEPIVIPKEEIDAEIERLASLPQPENGRRRSVFVHPRNQKSNGLAPGIEVTLDVLKPGERTLVFRQNSTQVNFVIQGKGSSFVGGKHFDVNLYDVWNTPSMQTYWHQNTGNDLLVRLTYSNAALLDMMNVHYAEENPSPVEPVAHEALSEEDKKRRSSPFGTFKLNDEGAWLMPYEILINPPTVESPALHWPWQEVKSHLDKLEAL